MIKWVKEQFKEDDPAEETTGHSKHEEEDLIRKCALGLDSYFRRQKEDFFFKCMRQLGLEEVEVQHQDKRSLMIQPIKQQERKLDSRDIEQLVKRLYPPVEQLRTSHLQSSQHLNSTGLRYRQEAQQLEQKLAKQWNKSLEKSGNFGQQKQKLMLRKNYGRRFNRQASSSQN